MPLEYVKILYLSENETVRYAAEELQKYMIAMSRGKVVPQIAFSAETPARPLPKGIVLGTLEDLDLPREDLEDPFIEDIIHVDVTGCWGFIAGSNPRSILMGVYRYCASAGCRFIRPGPDGDYIPHVDLLSHGFIYRKKADQPFRGECSEGAISYEHMRDTVYWLPKIGMNMYMIEGIVPYTYMHKWYGHIGNSKLRRKGQITDYDMLKSYVNLLEQDVRKTGIQLHTLGHGWMFEKIGVPDMSTPRRTRILSDDDKRHLALVNGNRDIFKGSQFNTQFCYSSPDARKLLVDTLVEYIREKPFVDFVHVWLADAINNHCECEECVKMQPSDYYVMLLNELDAELTAMGSETRIVFIMYTDTQRPPQKMRLKNPHRFTLLTAIGLHYETGYTTEEFTGEEPPFMRNTNPAAVPAALRLKWHRDWKALCDNIPSIIFEYRFYADMYCDLGHMQLSHETHRDMKSLENVSFQGCMSDQTHRMYMPTSLPLIMMGETLFDHSIDFDQFTDDYFLGAFGEGGAKCRAYLEELSVLLSPSNYRVGGRNGVEEEGLGKITVHKQSWVNNPEVAERARRIPDLVLSFIPEIENGIAAAADNARLLSWVYLRQHSEICLRFAEVLLAGAEGDMERAKEKYEVLAEYVSAHELEFHNAFDLFLFLRSVRMKLGLGNFKYYD